MRSLLEFQHIFVDLKKEHFSKGGETKLEDKTKKEVGEKTKEVLVFV